MARTKQTARKLTGGLKRTRRVTTSPNISIMPSAGGVYSETLQSITTTKLRELAKKRRVYEDQKASILSEAQLAKDHRARIEILVNGIKNAFHIRTNQKDGRVIKGASSDPRLEILLANLQRFLDQARYDPSISTDQLQEWESALMDRLNVQSLKFQYADLYGQLTNEWLMDEQGTLPVQNDDEDEEDEGVDKMDYQKEIKEDKRQQQREQWESIAFKELATNSDAIQSYLKALFTRKGDNDQLPKAFKTLKDQIFAFGASLTNAGQFNTSILQWVIKGLISSDLLSNEKCSVLKDFQNSEVILTEISDVLNMRMAALDTWSWEGDVQVEQRRRVSGRYDIFMHEDLLQAIFLQFIGVKWSVFLKQALKRFMDADGAWKPLTPNIPKKDMKRRFYFLQDEESLQPSLRSYRKALFKDVYFMTQLLNSEYEEHYDADGVEEAHFDAEDEDEDVYEAMEYSMDRAPGAAPRRQLASKAMRMAAAPMAACRSAPVSYAKKRARLQPQEQEDIEYLGDHLKPKTPMERKQKILHILATEIIINKRLHGDFTCFRSNFENLGSTLPHSTLFTVLKFLGVPNNWIQFFQKFLQAPLRFLQDPPEVEARVQKRGVPKSHVLSEVFVESVLFCVDFSVNQAADGAQLIRMSDEFWLWGKDHQKAVKAWGAITGFAKIMGLSLNKSKAGTVRITTAKKDNKIDPSLPTGTIRWGFLYLDPKIGKWAIDQTIVDQHIAELRSQLEDKKSVFAWVKAWNTYASVFFTTNFGTPANCFGREHIDDMLSTFSRIQRSIFSSSGSVVEHLKTTLRERFGTNDIPDGYIYFPTELGGLELNSPFISLLQIRDTITADKEKLLDTFLENEKTCYLQAKKTFEEDHDEMPPQDDPDFSAEDATTFFSFEEYTRYREDLRMNYGNDIRGVYDTLLQKPTEESIDANQEVLKEMETLQRLGMGGGITGDWDGMTGYWKWVVGLYGLNMVRKFGGLNVVDPGLLPIAMVSMFRSGRVKWQG